MLNGTFKTLTAILILAGALTAKSEATPTRHSPVISVSSVGTPKVSHRLPAIEDGCVELRAPAPAKVEAPAAPAAGGTCS